MGKGKSHKWTQQETDTLREYVDKHPQSKASDVEQKIHWPSGVQLTRSQIQSKMQQLAKEKDGTNLKRKFEGDDEEGVELAKPLDEPLEDDGTVLDDDASEDDGPDEIAPEVE